MKPSPTLAMTAKARRLQSEGHDVVSFAAGEPDFNTPEPVCEAAIKALRDGVTKYTPSAGLPALRQAVAAKLSRENGLAYDPDQVVVSCGAKHSVFNALQALIDPGDEVLLLAPYWMTYRDQILLAGGVPVTVAAEAREGFVPSIDRLREAVTPRTRALILNSPSNPTGATFSRAQLKELAALAIRHDLWVVSDEIYERLTYDTPHTSLAALGRDVAERTVTVTGCSKTYAMTGWRIGFAAAPRPVAQAMSNLQDQVTSNPTSFAQMGAIAALELGPESVEAMREEFLRRRDQMCQRLRAIPGVTLDTPSGAFYCFPDVSPFLERFGDDVGLADFLLEDALVATIPGSVFEGPGHLRLSYAASPADIEKGLERVADSLAKL